MRPSISSVTQFLLLTVLAAETSGIVDDSDANNGVRERPQSPPHSLEELERLRSSQPAFVCESCRLVVEQLFSTAALEAFADLAVPDAPSTRRRADSEEEAAYRAAVAYDASAAYNASLVRVIRGLCAEETFDAPLRLDSEFIEAHRGNLEWDADNYRNYRGTELLPLRDEARQICLTLTHLTPANAEGSDVTPLLPVSKPLLFPLVEAATKLHEELFAVTNDMRDAAAAVKGKKAKKQAMQKVLAQQSTKSGAPPSGGESFEAVNVKLFPETIHDLTLSPQGRALIRDITHLVCIDGGGGGGGGDDEDDDDDADADAANFDLESDDDDDESDEDESHPILCPQLAALPPMPESKTTGKSSKKKEKARQRRHRRRIRCSTCQTVVLDLEAKLSRFEVGHPPKTHGSGGGGGDDSAVVVSKAIATEVEAVCNELRWRHSDDEVLAGECDALVDEEEAGLAAFLRAAVKGRRDREARAAADAALRPTDAEVFAAVAARRGGRLKKVSDLGAERDRLWQEARAKAGLPPPPPPPTEPVPSAPGHRRSSELRALGFCQDCGRCDPGDDGDHTAAAGEL